MKTLNKLQLFANALDIGIPKLRSLRRSHYSIWLFCEIYNSTLATGKQKNDILNMAYSLIHNETRVISGADVFFLGNSSLLAPWLLYLHLSFFQFSNWSK